MRTSHHARSLTLTDIGLYIRVTSSLDHVTVSGILTAFTARADLIAAGHGRPLPGERWLELTVGTGTEVRVHPDDRVEAWDPVDIAEPD